MKNPQRLALSRRWLAFSNGLLLSLAVLTVAASASAEVLWDGDASGGTNIFKLIGSNCETPGSVSAVSDQEMGLIWRYEKGIGSNRCESHGIRIDGDPYAFQNDTTYYFGWWSRVSNEADNNALFQWKAYDDHLQNWPVVLKLVEGDLVMLQRQPDNMVSTIWTGPFEENVWTHIALGLHLSDELTGAWVELYVDGEQQTFIDESSRYACRLFDGGHVCPKWGVYGAEEELIQHDVAGLLIGTTYDDVKMPGDDPEPGTGGAEGSGGDSAAGGSSIGGGSTGGAPAAIGGMSSISSGGAPATGGSPSSTGGDVGDGIMEDDRGEDPGDPVGCSCSQAGPRPGSWGGPWLAASAMAFLLASRTRKRHFT